jgi:phage virion morphogenesis protein
MTVKLTGDWSKCKAAMAAMSRLDFTDVHKKIGGYLVDDVQERFDSGVGPDGKAWKPSARAEEGEGQTLVDSARLKNSVTYKAAAKSVEVGTNVKYARIHQFGGVIKPKTAKALRFRVGGTYRTVKQVRIPARPFLGLSEENGKESVAILRREIERRIK